MRLKLQSTNKYNHQCQYSVILCISRVFSISAFLEGMNKCEILNCSNQICQLEHRFFSCLSDSFPFFDSFLWMIHKKEEMRHNAEKKDFQFSTSKE